MRVVTDGQGSHMKPGGTVQNPPGILHIRASAGNKKDFIQRKHGICIFCKKQMAHVDRIEGPAHNSYFFTPAHNCIHEESLRRRLPHHLGSSIFL